MSYKIAVTGVGGGVGQSILKSLYNSGYDVVGLDGDSLAAGLFGVSKSYIIPYANSPEYIPVLLDICKKESIDILFPGLDAELQPLSLNKDKFKSVGTTVVVSNLNVVSVSDNKQFMFDQLREKGINVPMTVPFNGFNLGDLDYPIIIKQMIGGARSMNVFLVRDNVDYNTVSEKINGHQENFIVQEYIEGDEYTCGTLNLDNSCKGVIVMRRILRDGDTYKCFSEKNLEIENEVRKTVDAIKPFGACNVQLRVRNGVPYVFEVNARCSGTTASRTLCGFNEPKLIADYILKGIEPNFKIKYQTILRYWKELVVENSTIDSLKENKMINLDNYIEL